MTEQGKPFALTDFTLSLPPKQLSYRSPNLWEAEIMGNFLDAKVHCLFFTKLMISLLRLHQLEFHLRL
jgi:hypothetical protein